MAINYSSIFNICVKNYDVCLYVLRFKISEKKKKLNKSYIQPNEPESLVFECVEGRVNVC